MRILGEKVNDYYDCCISQFGLDKSGNIFLREPSTLQIPFKSKYDKTKIENVHLLTCLFNDNLRTYHYVKNIDNEKINIVINFVIFAGKTYPFVRLYSEPGAYGKNFDNYFYSYENLLEFYEKELKLIMPEKADKKKSYWYSSDDSQYWNKEYLQKLFSNIRDYSALLSEYKIVIGLPKIFRYYSPSSYEIEINIELKNIQFYKCLDAYTAYQELAMFVDAKLEYPGNIMINIEDKYRIAAHGFDHKYAFKKEPTKKRK
jgi:hypothetical protein